MKDKGKEDSVKELIDQAEEIKRILDEADGSLWWQAFTLVPVVGDACDLVDTCKTIKKVKEKLEVLDKKYDELLRNLRNLGVDRAWARERERLAAGKPGSRKWTDAQRRQILMDGRAKGRDGKTIHGHHKKPVKDYPEHADDPDNIEFMDEIDHIEFHRTH